MAITDFSTDEVRIRQDAEFIQIPNLIEAGDDLANGQFVFIEATFGTFLKASQDDRATHLVLKSGIGRNTAVEIATLIGIVQKGEPTTALTGGPGIVTIPFKGNVRAGQQLTTDAGYAVGWSDDSGATGAFVIGEALDDVTVDSSTGIGWGDALLNLPAQFSPRPGGAA